MKVSKESLDLLNNYLSKNLLEVSTFPDKDLWEIKTKIKLEITGIKEYIRIGEKINHLEYTITILPSDNKTSNKFNSAYAEIYGRVVKLTTSSREYYDLRMACNQELVNILKYFGIDLPVICTRVINEVKTETVNESFINEGRLDSVIRQIVRDIIVIFKRGKSGEFGLPEDLHSELHAYEFDQLDSPLQVFLEIEDDESVEGFDADANFYSDDESIHVIIKSNPRFGNTILYDLVGELNELIAHELQHLRQKESGEKFPKKEPKSPMKYYSQPHELDAQTKGFKRRSKLAKFDYETLIRRWFDENKHKHNLNPQEAEGVIQKLLKIK